MQPLDLAEGSGESSGGLEVGGSASDQGPQAHAISGGSEDSDLEGVQTAFNQASRGLEERPAQDLGLVHWLGHTWPAYASLVLLNSW
eukprot:scaffold65295_cov21-Tisochrysis_lutea.AAC.2